MDEDGNDHSVLANGKYRALLPPGKDVTLMVMVMLPIITRNRQLLRCGLNQGKRCIWTFRSPSNKKPHRARIEPDHSNVIPQRRDPLLGPSHSPTGPHQLKMSLPGRGNTAACGCPERDCPSFKQQGAVTLPFGTLAAGMMLRQVWCPILLSDSVFCSLE